MAEPERKMFTRVRRTLMPHSPLMDELERDFGYLNYIPYDVPPIRANNQDDLVSWFRRASKPIRKIGYDVAGGTSSVPMFRSIDSPSMQNSIWETNRQDLFAEFPELRDQIRELPILSVPDFSIWSNLSTVYPHRDHGPWRDLPNSIRIVLYDDSTEPTQILEETPPNSKPISRFEIPKLIETNTFGWNNIRTKHSTKPSPGKMKLLLILHSPWFRPKMYRDLLERSVAKYGHLAYASPNPASMYYDPLLPGLS